MRIGIITFHHVYNYGAFLQAAGTYGILGRLGHTPEIIDYWNPALERLHEQCIAAGLNPLNRYRSLIRKRRFLLAQAGLARSTRASSHGQIDWSRYDAVVYGSDEIWNYSGHVHGFDPVYFGGHAPASVKRIAYAPSLGEMEWGAKDAPERLGALIGSFDMLAVRDHNTADFIHHLTGQRAPLVLDPAFLHHDENLMPAPRHGRPYVLVYGEIRDRNLRSACSKWAGRLGCRTISVGYRNPWCDQVVLSEGPYEFLGWVRDARAVVTTTFHGTVFSIKFNRPFVTLRSPKARKKFIPMLDDMGLTSRVISTPDELVGIPAEQDWKSPRIVLAERTARSIELLGSALA